MREILFRGKDFETGEWIFGYYFFEPQRLLHCIAGFNTENIVDPKTVGQYTGLYDKKGKKIFEGDILKNLEYCEIGYVDYELHGCPNFVVQTDDGVLHYKTLFIEMPDYDMEVIGNKFDNPELIPIYKAEEYQDY